MSYQQFSPDNLKKTSIMAMVSLGTSIAAFFIIPVLGSVIGVITGNMAKKEIQGSGGAIAGENLAKLGVTIGWVGIALDVIGICCGFITFALPIFGSILIATFPFLAELFNFIKP